MKLFALISKKLFYLLGNFVVLTNGFGIAKPWRIDHDKWWVPSMVFNVVLCDFFCNRIRLTLHIFNNQFKPEIIIKLDSQDIVDQRIQQRSLPTPRLPNHHHPLSLEPLFSCQLLAIVVHFELIFIIKSLTLTLQIFMHVLFTFINVKACPFTLVFRFMDYFVTFTYFF